LVSGFDDERRALPETLADAVKQARQTITPRASTRKAHASIGSRFRGSHEEAKAESYFAAQPRADD